MKDDNTVFVGLDVHKDTIAIAVAEDGRGELRFVGTCGPQLRELLKPLAHLGDRSHTLIAYEAGPSGFALARQLAAEGWRCQVIAVSKTPRKPGERIKTDRRDALALARYLRSGDLTPVVIPDAQDEAIRDLSRARQDAVRARLKVRQQLKAMLLRHGKRFPGKTSWGAAHERYLARVGFDHPAQQIAFAEYRTAVMESHERVERITKPLLIAQGANDPRVVQKESDQLVAEMKSRNIPVTYVLYPDEGHGFARPENRTSFYAVSEGFLAKCLGGRFQPIGDDFKGSSAKVLEGVANVPGLAEAMKP